MKAHYPVILAAIMTAAGCSSDHKSDQKKLETQQTQAVGTFGYDLAFLKKYKDAVVLAAPDNDEYGQRRCRKQLWLDQL